MLALDERMFELPVRVAVVVEADPGEPNDDEASAYDFGETDCKDSSTGMVYGVLARFLIAYLPGRL